MDYYLESGKEHTKKKDIVKIKTSSVYEKYVVK